MERRLLQNRQMLEGLFGQRGGGQTRASEDLTVMAGAACRLSQPSKSAGTQRRDVFR